MSVPPYVVACVFCIEGVYVDDRLQSRGVFMISFLVIAVTGMVMVVAGLNPHVKYARCVIAATKIYANVPGGVAWTSNTAGGALKRSVAIAMHVGG